MLIRICVIIFFTALTIPSFAQKRTNEKIIGTVKTTDGQPAEYISVSLKNTIYGGISDDKGNFEFEAPSGDYTMTVYSILAHRKEFPVTIQSGIVNRFDGIEIIENKTQLDEVVVTGQFTPQSLKNSLYKVRVINSQQIEHKASTSVESLLNTEIGIRLSNDAMLGETQFELMGMGGNNVKVLVDGIPLVDRGETKQSLSQIDINNIEQVEIVEGPMSVIYGTDALAGVINIITKKAAVSEDRNRYSISARIQEESVGNEYDFFDGDGLHNENVSANWAFKKGYYVNGSFTRNSTGGWTGDETGREKRWPPKDQYIYSGTVGYKKKYFNAWYRLDYLNEKLFNPSNAKPIAPDEISDRNYLTDRYTHQLQSDWKINNRIGINLIASYQDYKRRTHTTVTDISTGEKWLSGDESAQDISKYEAAFVRMTAAWVVSPTLSLQPGVEYNWDKGSGGRIDGIPDITSSAVFLSAEWKPIERIGIRPGIRTIINSDYDAPFAIPSFGTKFALNGDMDLRLSYAYGFRAPTLQELYFSFHNANHNIDGNPNLKAEYSNNFTGSFTWRIMHSGKIRITSTLSGFFNSFKDQIKRIPDKNDSSHITYGNIDSFKTTGGTLENSLAWGDLHASLGVSVIGRYMSLKDEHPNSEIPDFRFSPEISSSITYNITKTKTNLSFFYKFSGERKEYKVDSESNELYLGGIGSYNWADFTVSQKAGKCVTINAGVKNLFDVTNVYNDNTPTLIGCGRSYFVGVSYLFNN